MSKYSDISRRSVLKTIGSSSALGALAAGSASARDSRDEFRSLIERGLAVRDRADEQAAIVAENIRESSQPNAEERARQYRRETTRRAWLRYLKANDLRVASRHSRFQLGPATEGISTQRVQNVDTTGVDATISMITDDFNEYHVELSFQLYFDVDSTGSGHTGCQYISTGESPLDTGGLGWKSTCWNYTYSGLSQTTSTSSHVSYNDDVYSENSFGFEIDDKQLFDDWAADNTDCSTTTGDVGGSGYSDYQYFGVYLTEESDPNCNGDDDTYILGIYDHNWTGSYGNFSVGLGASYAGPTISIGYSEETSLEHEPTTTESDNDTPLKVTKDDATYVGNL